MKDYVQFNLYGDNWGELAETGKYVFQNKDHKVGKHNVLAFLVFHFVVNYDLSNLELFFRLAGFSAFTREEMPGFITNPDVINLPNKKHAYTEWFGGYTEPEAARTFIESELGKGIISKYEHVKSSLLYHEISQLLKQLSDEEQNNPLLSAAMQYLRIKEDNKGFYVK